jgi:hypothetical protein
MSRQNQDTTGEKEKEHWMNSKWRPMMGWMYMLVCIMDFVGFPVLWSLLQAYDHGQVTSQWQPLTLQGAGLFHLAMGAVIGISAYGRTQEKMSGAETGGLGSFGPGVGTTYVPPAANMTAQTNQTGFGSTSASSPSFGSASSSGFGQTSSYTPPSPVPVTGQVASGFGGKPGPVIAPLPAI